MDRMLEELRFPVRMFKSSSDFLREYTPGRPGCLVLAVAIAEPGAMDELERLLVAGLSLPIIVVTPPPGTRSCVRAVQMGVLDVLDEPVGPHEFRDCVRQALARDRKLVRGAASAYVSEVLPHLTTRERGILGLLVSGQTLKQIAAHCRITVQSVWKHKRRILSKFGVANEVELAHLTAACYARVDGGGMDASKTAVEGGETLDGSEAGSEGADDREVPPCHRRDDTEDHRPGVPASGDGRADVLPLGGMVRRDEG